MIKQRRTAAPVATATEAELAPGLPPVDLYEVRRAAIDAARVELTEAGEVMRDADVERRGAAVQLADMVRRGTHGAWVRVGGELATEREILTRYAAVTRRAYDRAFRLAEEANGRLCAALALPW